MSEVDYGDESQWGMEPGDEPIETNKGYKGTAYALAELMDNSIQWNANKVWVLIGEKKEVVGSGREMYRRSKIWVVDNGEGMDPFTLRMSLQIGKGTGKNKKDGMSKFGRGLPEASINMCDNYEAWSWQDGPENTFTTGINILDEEWLKTEKRPVPKPEKKELPREISKFCDIEASGTAICWKDLTRVREMQGETLYRQSNELVGRMYRNWLKGAEPSVEITFVIFDTKTKKVRKSSKGQEMIFKVHANDPLYRITGEGIPSHSARYVSIRVGPTSGRTKRSFYWAYVRILC